MNNLEEVLKDTKSRYDIPWIINDFNLNFGVEVGVFEGDYSKHLLDNSNLKALYMVDLWPIKYNQKSPDSEDGLKIFNKCIKKLESHKPRAVFLRTYSDIACNFFKEESLDFIYIDACHRYSSVVSDLNSWWPVLKIGGLFCGHDYKDIGLKQVKRAVDEFALSRYLKVYSTQERCPSWLILK